MSCVIVSAPNLSARRIFSSRSRRVFNTFKFKTHSPRIASGAIDIEVSYRSCNTRSEAFVCSHSSTVPPFFFHLAFQAGAPRPTLTSPGQVRRRSNYHCDLSKPFQNYLRTHGPVSPDCSKLVSTKALSH